ncbi:leucine-rich repeat domain-containing protein [Brachyspira alvinipulli]|uniref:leucine-rich repeat domain-containing protein n=1 Tax=Brachyspira alvinipulli TaxID=84379 RepID=UPI0004BBF3AA|nr:leucine-rich repeat domain-containing protein [Brachyspira alvinipulli]
MKKDKYKIFIKINLLLFISIFFISCSNYIATDPLASSGYGYDIYSIPDNVDPKYLIKADTKEADIENIMNQYFSEYGSYIIFLSDTKENINKNGTIAIINGIIKKNEYLQGVALDLSRTDMTEIKANAFENNNNLANIKLPNTITTIGESAFKSCVSLRNINFPSSITEIGEGAFHGCYILSHVDLQNTKITKINQQTFYDCASLKTVLLPNSLTDIGATSFNYCLSLTHITLPQNVTIIEQSAFSDCKSLKSIELNNKLTTISGFAFFNCVSLEKISLPKYLTKMEGDYILSGCTSLKSIEYLGENNSVVATGKVFEEYNGGSISVPASTPINLYLPKAASIDTGWDNFLGYNWKDTGRNIYKQAMP